jgi:ElaB/YqjD/DUF883 family membrane-anchored ribosome-binding protein
MTQASSSFNRGTDYGHSSAEDLASKATDQIERVVSSVEQTARTIADQGRQAGEQVGVVADNFKTAVDKSVKDQPLTTLAVAAAMGFVIGAIWKS